MLRALAILCLSAGAPVTPKIIFWASSDLNAKDEAGTGLIPLGCLDPRSGTLRGGADCLPLLPKGATVEVGTRKVRTTGRRTVACALGDTQLPGIGLKEHAEIGELAQYPRLTFKVPKARTPSALEIGSAVPLVERLAKGKERLVWTQWTTDLDGDGAADRLLSVDIGSGHDGEGPRMGALILIRGKQPALLLASEEGASYKIIGVGDLDGDAKSEWVLERGYFEGTRFTLERLTADRMDTIGGGDYCGS